jgi:hypothetical protein
MDFSFIESGIAEAAAREQPHLCFEQWPLIIFAASLAAVNWLCRYAVHLRLSAYRLSWKVATSS